MEACLFSLEQHPNHVKSSEARHKMTKAVLLQVLVLGSMATEPSLEPRPDPSPADGGSEPKRSDQGLRRSTSASSLI